MKKEIHIFIIWEKARHMQERIVTDIQKKFEILEAYSVKWSEEKFAENLTRFYGLKLKNNSQKERHCGKGAFLLLIVQDPNPKYELRKTSKGSEKVNSNLFDAKLKYRKWTGGGHKIHATNSIKEVRHDIILLLGISLKDYTEKSSFKNWDGTIIPVEQDLYGTYGWKNIVEVFGFLNETTEYLILRNYEGFPEKLYLESHEDIDLLAVNKNEIVHLLNAKKFGKKKYRVQYKILVGEQDVLLDIRSPGDNYYDRLWQEEMLRNRKLYNKCMFVMDQEDYFYSLLYHALIHKPNISKEYKKRLINMAMELSIPNIDTLDSLREHLARYMEQKNYSIVEPYDLSVYFNKRYTRGKRETVRRKIFLVYVKIRHSIKVRLRGEA